MSQARTLLFLICIALGVAGGLALGWLVSPLDSGNATPAMLRDDYQLDYVLMVAEVYQNEADAALAAHRLAWVSERPALRLAQEAIVQAGEIGYARADIELLAQLAGGLAQIPGQAGGTP